MKLNKWILFCGTICMVVIGSVIEEPSMRTCGLTLMWIGLAVE